MDKSVPATPAWGVIERLYDDLKRVESSRPGSVRALDIEAAIDLMLDGSVTSTSPDFLARDAVRRATFLRGQATAQRSAASARRRPAHTITNAARSSRAARESSDADYGPADPCCVEDIVCADDLAERIAATSVNSVDPHRARAVMNGLRRDLATATIATELRISASTVLRTITDLRAQARTLMSAAA